MSIFVAELKQRRSDGSYRVYYTLRMNYWDKEKQATQQVYLGSLGKEKKITRSKAREICEKHDLELADLEAIRGLEIVED